MISGFPEVRDEVAGKRVHVAIKRSSKKVPNDYGVVCTLKWR